MNSVLSTHPYALRRKAFVLVHLLVTLVITCTYFAFRVELFDEEAEAHCHDFPTGLSITVPSLTWETYDKDNAPEAFSVQVLTAFEVSFAIPPAMEIVRQDILPYQPVRDKSPPLAVSTL